MRVFLSNDLGIDVAIREVNLQPMRLRKEFDHLVGNLFGMRQRVVDEKNLMALRRWASGYFTPTCVWGWQTKSCCAQVRDVRSMTSVQSGRCTCCQLSNQMYDTWCQRRAESEDDLDEARWRTHPSV